MRTAEDVAIIGAYASPVTRSAPKPLREMFADAAIATLRDAGVDPKSVDGLVTTPPGINPGVVVMFEQEVVLVRSLRSRASWGSFGSRSCVPLDRDRVTLTPRSAARLKAFAG